MMIYRYFIINYNKQLNNTCWLFHDKDNISGKDYDKYIHFSY